MLHALHFVFAVEFWIDDEEGDHVETVTSWPEPIQSKVDKKIRDDKIDLKYIFYNAVLPIRFEYRPADRTVHLWTRKPSNAPTTAEELAQMLSDISPDEGGPDGWMERDLDILDQDDLRQLGMGTEENAEFVPVIKEVYEVVNDTEYLVDLTKLPRVRW